MNKKIKLAGAILAGVMAFTAAPAALPALNTVSYAASKLAAPTGIKGSAKDTSITISWNAVSGANAYRVFKYNSKTGKYDTVKNVSATSCKIDGLTANTSYVFRVAALVKSGNSYTVQTLSKDIKAKTKLAAPANLKAASKTKTSIKLTWDAVKGAAAYRVYYAAGTAVSKDDIKVYKNVSSNYCNVKGLSAGKTYGFMVVALAKNGNKYTEQTFSDAIIASTSGSSGSAAASGDLFPAVSYGKSGATVAEQIGLTDYQTVTQEMKGTTVSALTGYVVKNGQPCVASVIEGSDHKAFAVMLVYDQNVTSFDSAYSVINKAKGAPMVNYEMMGMKMYMWMDKSLNVTALIGADTKDKSMTIYYGLSYKYAPEEIKNSIGKDGGNSMTDITQLFA